MARYVALAWDANTPHLAENSLHISTSLKSSLLLQPNWVVARDTPGLLVLSRKSQFDIHTFTQHGADGPLSLGGGAVIGKLFRASASTRQQVSKSQLTQEEVCNIVSTNGEFLIEEFWGNYVSFINNPQDGAVSIIRDPSGAVPCYHFPINGVHIFFSDFEDIKSIGLPRIGFNDDYIRIILFMYFTYNSSTGLKGVTKLLQGERFKIARGGGIYKEFIWSPGKFISKNNTITPDMASDRLREVVSSCVSAWASEYDRLVLALSGGLDSNIVLAGCRSAGASSTLTAFHYRFPGDPADEGLLAADAAQRARVQYIEKEVRADALKLFEVHSVPRSVECIHSPVTLALRRIQSEVYNERGASALLCGNGGDEVFFQFPNAKIAADYAWEHGVTNKLWQTILDTARLSRMSVFHCLKVAIKEGLFRATPTEDLALNFADRPGYFDAIEAGADPEVFLHPWLAQRASWPPAKRRHVFYISFPTNIYSAPAQYWGVNEISPLYSQPIFELVLSIPSYVLAWNGWDRGLARKAFSKVLPPAIAWKEAKAGGNRFFDDVAWAHRSQIKEILLDGYLINNGFLCKTELERILKDEVENKSEIASCLNFIGIELWLQSWQ